MFAELVVVALTGFLLYYLLLLRKPLPKHWKKHGIRYIDSSGAASNFEMFFGNKSIVDRDNYAYKMMAPSEKFCGIIESPAPVVLVKDLDVVKKIMIKDFDHFVNRREFFPVTEHNIIAKMLGFLKNDQWKGVRSSMSPTFTTGKIRRMMEHFNGVGNEWVDMLKKKCTAGKGSTDIDVLKTMNQYTVEVIATVVFGIYSGTVQDPNAPFCTMSAKINSLNFIDALKLNLGPRYPKLLSFFGVDVLNMEAIGFFETLLRQSLEQRLKGGVKRNDFQQLLIEAQKGQLKAEGSDELSTFEKEALLGGEGQQKGIYLTDDIIVANCLVFFLAGFLTTSTFISMAAYVLAANPDVQEKLKNEVDKIVKKDGTVDYDELGQLPYMEMFTSEVLRLYPAATRLEREALKDYHDKESGLFVPKGSVVVVPIMAIHHDPTHYPNPDRFDPENFSAERKAKRNPYSYMPFGIGPRNCIGMRFALVESKACLAHLVHNFKITPTEKTPMPVRVVAAGLQTFTPNDLELRLTPRQ